MWWSRNLRTRLLEPTLIGKDRGATPYEHSYVLISSILDFEWRVSKRDLGEDLRRNVILIVSLLVSRVEFSLSNDGSIKDK